MSNFTQKYGSHALITGASAGIGEQFAWALAQRGLNLVVVARRQDKLVALGNEIANRCKVDVRPLTVDLSAEKAVDQLVDATHDLTVGLVVINAAILTAGAMLQNDLADEVALLKLNSLVPLQLAHRFGNLMRPRRRGGLLFVSSLVGNYAAPYQANYAASKAYVSSLALALNVELRPVGIDVTAVTPGLTRTEGVETAQGIDFSKMPTAMMDPARVVQVALDALGRRPLAVPGRVNSTMDLVFKHILPRTVSTRLFGALSARTVGRSRLLR